MKLFLDSADTAQWRLPPGCPQIHGITTNPTIVHQAGLAVSLATYLSLIAAAGDQQVPELMLQLPQADPDEATQWTTQLVAAAKRSAVEVTIKLPCHPEWLPALHAVRAQGQKTLLTGLSNPMQLLWASECGANYVAPYVGRLQADGRDVWPLIEACVVQQNNGGPKLLAASIKSSDVLSRLIAMGAYAVTVRPEFAASLARDALTQSAIAQFDADVIASVKHQKT